ncbi:MAG: hypothetical protein JWO38_5057 [Gemmataceae bacterium]|nr:hypothetical protein [Gemmataceae bacterium]
MARSRLPHFTTCNRPSHHTGNNGGAARGERPKPRQADGGRERCREDVLAAVRAACRPLTRKEVIRALKAAGGDHGAGTVAKALADLTRSGELLNLKDKRGYRLPGWVRRHPGLFDEV